MNFEAINQGKDPLERYSLDEQKIMMMLGPSIQWQKN